LTTAEEVLLLAYILAAFWYVAGLTSVQFALVRGWQSSEIGTKVEAFEEASHYQGVLLVPGGIAVVATGLFFWGAMDYNLLGPAWLLLLELLYVLTLVVCLPLIGIGLRRARFASLQARRTNKATPELEEAMSDSVPLVFGGLATIILPLGAALSVFRPF
jgi:hypothetical protein